MTKASDTRVKRIKKVVLLTAFFLCIGFLYAGFAALTGYNIPCIIRVVTGIRCPGCGITHGMLALLRLDFEEALRYNLFLPIILFYIIILYSNCVYRYIQKGTYNLTSGSTALDIIFLTLICMWGILRNIAGM